MKRKNLWLLAPPLIGLVLVWRAGEQRREQSDVPSTACAVALRAILAERMPNASKVFVSVDGHDPSPSFLSSFNDLRTTVLPASGPPPASRIEPDFNLSMQCRTEASNATVHVQGVPFSGDIMYSLKLHDGQWKVFTWASF